MIKIHPPFDNLFINHAENNIREGELQAEKDLEDFKNNLIKSFNSM